MLHPLCPIKRDESLCEVLTLSLRHNLTKAATEDILKLLKKHLPPTISFPTNYNALLKSVEMEGGFLEKIYYCDGCHVELKEFNCAQCNTTFNEDERRRNAKFFYVMNIRKQILTLLENPTIKTALARSFSTMNVASLYSGIRVGLQYLKLPKGPCDLTCTFNVDGVPVFNSSNSSIHPVLIAINE